MMLPLLSGGIIGLTLGLLGAGGSILALPLLLLVVKMPNAHLALGTSAVAVAVNAFAGLMFAWHQKNIIKWRCGLVFSLFGIGGAFLGSSIGKSIQGEKLVFLFGLLMVGMGIQLFFKKSLETSFDIHLTKENAPKLAFSGALVGLMAGFFGIGGGFLITPALMLAAGLGFREASVTSLLAIFLFGLTTAFNYSLSGLVEWSVALWLILGGFIGAIIGIKLKKLIPHNQLKKLFALSLIGLGVRMIIQNIYG